MNIRRLIHVLIAFTLIAAAAAGRLFWLQAVWPAASPRGADATGPAARSVLQRAESVVTDSGRGLIVDRNGNVLAGRQAAGLLLLPGGAESNSGTVLSAMAETLGEQPEQLLNAWRSLRKPAWWTPQGPGEVPAPLSRQQAARLRALRPAGAAVADVRLRYGESPLAAHFVGFVAEQPERLKANYGDRIRSGKLGVSTPIGAAGLELAFDRFLLGAGETRIASYTDGAGQYRLEGLGIRTAGGGNPHYPLRLVTTLDLDLQRAAESAADRAGLKEGAVVVLDVRNADIAAMVSRPAFDPKRPGDPAEGAWANRALMTFPPGSVMKSFIAAVALQSGVVSERETFHCSGAYSRYGLMCWKAGGHGRLTFGEALAKSCNVVFAEVGERLKGTELQQYAEALGLVGTVGWKGTSAIDGQPLYHLPEEQPGRLFAGHPAGTDGGVLAQTAIGQRDVRLSPLAAANWMVTLLHGGPAFAPRAALSLRAADGIALERYERKFVQGTRAALSPAVTVSLRRMLERVASQEGTAPALAGARWKLAGKSGTAEDISGGRLVVHQWFVGYGPADRPRYAVAVLAAFRPPESQNLAAQIFREVMDALAKAEATR